MDWAPSYNKLKIAARIKALWSRIKNELKPNKKPQIYKGCKKGRFVLN